MDLLSFAVVLALSW